MCLFRKGVWLMSKAEAGWGIHLQIKAFELPSHETQQGIFGLCLPCGLIILSEHASAWPSKTSNKLVLELLWCTLIPQSFVCPITSLRNLHSTPGPTGNHLPTQFCWIFTLLIHANFQHWDLVLLSWTTHLGG